MMSRAEIQAMVVEGLSTTFRIDPSRITLDSHLSADLDIDSIDAVDLAARLQRTTGIRLTPEKFKAVRTVGDLIDALDSLLNSAAAGASANGPSGGAA